MSDRDDRARRVEREIFLRSLNVTRHLARAGGSIDELIRDAYFPPGGVVYRQGDASAKIYFVVSGQITLTSEGEPPRTLGDRSAVGIIDVMADRVRSRTATAATEVYALEIDAQDFFDAMEDDFEYARAAVLNVASQLHELSLSLSPTGGFPDPGRAPPVRIPVGRPLNIVERVTVLQEAPAFRGASVQALTSLAALIDEQHVGEGEVVFGRGVATGVFFVVVSGVVEIERELPPIRASFGPLDLVCGYAALGAAEEQYTARARRPAIVLRASEESFFDLMEVHFDLVRSLLGGMAIERERLMRLGATARPPAT